VVLAVDAGIEVGPGAGAGALVLALPEADKGDAGDDEDEDECAGGNTDDYGDGQARLRGVDLQERRRVDDGDLGVGKEGTVQAEEHARGGLLAAAGFKGHKVWAVSAYGSFPLDMHVNLQFAK
jgi:hypothetical protein